MAAPRYMGGRFCPEGTVIEREAIQGRTRLISPGAVYAMNPATKDAVIEAISRSERREIKVISVPASAQVALPVVDIDTYEPSDTSNDEDE